MLGETEYAEFLYSYTNGFDINQSIIVPLIRVHAPSENEDELGEEIVGSCRDNTSDINVSSQDLNSDNDSVFDKPPAPAVHHERDCYLMPYCYNDIRSMYMMLPRSRSKSLPHVVSSSPTLCEACKGCIQLPEHASLHRRKSAPVSLINTISFNSLVKEKYDGCHHECSEPIVYGEGYHHERHEPIGCGVTVAPPHREGLFCPGSHKRSASFSYFKILEADDTATDLYQVAIMQSSGITNSS